MKARSPNATGTLCAHEPLATAGIPPHSVHIPQCSWYWIWNSARKPAERTVTSGGPSGFDQRRAESSSSVGLSRLCAMTIEKPVSQSFPCSVPSKSLTSLSTASPCTLSFSSRRRGTASCARGFPMLSRALRKKLFPASAGVVMAESRREKWPMPGRTRFLRMEVDVAEDETTRMRADSSAAWPDAAHILHSVSTQV